jgi:hypothetical protein
MTTFDGQFLASVLVLAAFGAGAVLRGAIALRAFARASAAPPAETSATPAPRLAA